MKEFLRKHLPLFLTLLFMSTAMALLGQVPDTTVIGTPVGEDTFTNPISFAEGVEWIYGFLIILVGYLSPYIPVLKKIDSGIYRVLAVAIIIGLAFYFGMGSSLVNLLVTYTISTSFYEVVLKLIQKYLRKEQEA